MNKIRVICKVCHAIHYRLVSDLKDGSWTSLICQCGELIKFIPREFLKKRENHA